MGLYRYFSSSSYDQPSKPSDQLLLPRADNYKILDHCQVDEWLVLLVNYPDCRNYEGNKILVYKAVSLKELQDSQETLDPHFSSNIRYHSPFARFEPTKDGWESAVTFCRLVSAKGE